MSPSLDQSPSETLGERQRVRGGETCPSGGERYTETPKPVWNTTKEVTTLESKVREKTHKCPRMSSWVYVVRCGYTTPTSSWTHSRVLVSSECRRRKCPWLYRGVLCRVLSPVTILLIPRSSTSCRTSGEGHSVLLRLNGRGGVGRREVGGEGRGGTRTVYVSSLVSVCGPRHPHRGTTPTHLNHTEPPCEGCGVESVIGPWCRCTETPKWVVF